MTHNFIIIIYLFLIGTHVEWFKISLIVLVRNGDTNNKE